ncbi:MAG: hypothetical protein HZC41_13035 [Chloroflexi bacterium]|nr:hypothetical protein [Chloroflexota bacterium]
MGRNDVANIGVGARRAVPLQSRLGVTLLLAMLLAFGSEVLVWTNPVDREPLDWPLMLVAYTAVAAILLDLLVRYRVRDLFGTLLLTGVYSLLASLTLNPEAMLADLPRTLVTRIMGAHALLALEMVGLFLALTTGLRPRAGRILLVGGLVVGLAWGMWVRWFPAEAGYPAVSLPVMLAYGAAFTGVIVALRALLPRLGAITPEDLRLSRRGWLVVTLALAGLTIMRELQGAIPVTALLMVLPLLALCLVILWFRGRARGSTLLDGHLPPAPLAWGWLIVAAAGFLGAAVAGYNLPLLQVGEFTQLRLIGIGFTAYGLAWLPTVSLVLGVQAYLRQMQA